MEHPVKEIPHIIHSLTTGSPAEQKTALDTYFLPTASFSHPFCRVPGFSRREIPFLSRGSGPGAGTVGIDSRWVVLMVYRWYKILSPVIELDVESVVYDQKQQVLYVAISQVFSLFFVPLYAPRVKLVTLLHLSHDMELNKYYIKSQEDLYQFNEFIKFVLPGGALVLMVWQWFNSLLSVFGALVLAPVTWLEQRVAEKHV